MSFSYKGKLLWIPNLFTLGNLSLGFFAILLILPAYPQSTSNAHVISAILICTAMLLDGLDGFVARLFKAKSDLGAHLDSLADLVTFGIAPAVLLYVRIFARFNYEMKGHFYIPAGMFLSAIWPVCSAFRLARFNTLRQEDSFIGLPSPLAGCIVVLMHLVLSQVHALFSEVLIVIVYIFCAFMMVSTVRYSKPQVSFLRRFSKERFAIILCVGIFALFFIGWQYGAIYSAVAILCMSFVYVLTGLVAFVIHKIQEYRI